MTSSTNILTENKKSRYRVRLDEKDDIKVVIEEYNIDGPTTNRISMPPQEFAKLLKVGEEITRKIREKESKKLSRMF